MFLYAQSQSFFLSNFFFFRRLGQCSGSRRSSLWPNERSIIIHSTCCSQPSKGNVSRLYKEILKDERKIFSERRMAEEKKMETIPFDPRFPNQNQTRNCWQNYVDFHRCQKIKVDGWEMLKAIDITFCIAVITLQVMMKTIGRVRSTSLACSSRRTSRLFALQLGLRSGTSRGKK